MADALDPLTQWVYTASRDRTDSIELRDLYNSQLRQIVSLIPPVDTEPGYFDPEPEAAVDSLQPPAPNPLAKYVVCNANPVPIRSVLKSVLRHGNITALLETPYYDLEFWDMHAGFYDKCFREHARHCERVHFFRIGVLQEGEQQSDIQRVELRERECLEQLRCRFCQGCTWQEIQDVFQSNGGIQYLGYLVFRQVLSYSVCRAAILFDDRSEEQLKASSLRVAEARTRVGVTELERGGVPFLKAAHKNRVNILSTPVDITTMEFMQQDPNLGACATASLWVASRAMSERFRLNRFSYATITRQALGRASTSRDGVIFEPTHLNAGLSTDEIITAIERTGANALSFAPYHVKGVDRLAMTMEMQQEIYSLVESGIPVILCLGDDGALDGHAVVAVGHSLPSYETASGHGFVRPANSFLEVKENHYLVSSLAPIYYVHDDAYGPFNRITFSSDNKSTSYDQTLTSLHRKDAGTYPIVVKELGEIDAVQEPSSEVAAWPIVLRGGSAACPMYLMNAIAAVPPMVHGGTVNRLTHLLVQFDDFLLPGLKKKFHEEIKLLWRSLLIEGAEFKSSTRRRGYSDAITGWYGTMMLPKYIWLFEVSLVESDFVWRKCFSPYLAREILGEFIVDATTPADDFRCLAFRMREWGYDYRWTIDHPDEAICPKEFDLDERKCRYECYRE